ncbi:MAG: hypothetical protein WCH44_14530 [Betaproteobacteria bacterium]
MTKALAAPLRYALQIAAYAAFAAVIGYFSTSPPYRQRADNEALLKLSFSHSGQLKFACRERDPGELAKLQPNMRSKMDCPRERSLVLVELDMDEQPLFRISTAPLGLRRDGAATVYRRLAIPAGSHHFSARLADGPDGRVNFARELWVNLAPGQVLIVDFLSGSGGFVFTRG